MNNNLNKIENTLRSIAKRYRSVKYSLGLAILFLMMGTSAFSQDIMTNEQIAVSKENLKDSIGNLQSKIDTARAENEKGLAGLRLELIQLVEQGDQVIKSPWTSWQFGMTYMYSHWGAAYKGRGDKKKNQLLARDASEDPLARFTASSVSNSSYGTTDLALVSEPPAEIEVSAGIRPKDVNKQAPSFVPAAPAGALPPFEPKIITPPAKPTVDLPTITSPASLNYPGRGADPTAGYYSYWSLNAGNDGNISETSVESGEALKDYKELEDSGSFGANIKSTISIKNFTGAEGVRASGSTNDVGDSPTPLSNKTLSSDQDTRQFFMTLLDSPYSYFGTGAKVAVLTSNKLINNATSRGAVINLETEGSPNKTFQDLKNAGKILDSVFSDLNSYTTSTGLNNSTNGQLYHVNKGTVEIGGYGTRYIHTTYNGGGNRVNVIENRGSIVGMNYNSTGYTTIENIVYFHSPDSSASGAQHIYVNHSTGKIDMYGEKSVLTLYTAKNSQLSNGDVSFINNGTVNLYGKSSTAVAINSDAKGKLTAASSFILNKAVNLYGDNSVGLYVLNSGDGVKNAKNQAKFVIGDKSVKGLTYTPSNSLITKANVQPANSNKTGGDEDLTEGAVGVYLDNSDAELKTKLPQLDIEKYTKGVIGVYVNSGKATITAGNIKMNGGIGNVGLYAKGGNIDYTGNITMGGSALTAAGGNKAGSGNIGLYAANGKTIDLRGNLTTYNSNGATKDGTAVYSDKSTINLHGVTDIKLEAGTTGKNVGIYSSGSGSTVNVTTNGSKVDINGGTTNLGTALFSGNGGKIVADGTSLSNGLSVTVTNGATAVASVDSGSKVSMKYSTITYSGDGYALYTNGGGTIDASNSLINLGGKATGFETTPGFTSPITLTNTKIRVLSDNVTVMNIRNIGTLNYSTLGTTGFNSYLNGATIDPTSPATKYKLAAIDGVAGGYNIDADLDKSKATNIANRNTNDYIFTKNLAVQRAIVNLKAGKSVKAVLSGNDLTEIGDKTVVGLAMNSSKYATTNNETQINLEANTTVTADRTDSGNGAVGLFINYGKVTTNATSTINVEKEANTVNSGAVGIYSVNGSEVTNEGKINVGGKNAIGILGLAYRTNAAGAPLGAEFGTGATNQGRTTILNKGKVTLDGEGATGIFTKNNNSSATRATATATNDAAGILTLSGNKSVGMSGEKSTLTNTGTINIQGQESTGMFAKDSSEMTNNGTINLADSASADKPNIGMFTEDKNTVIHNNKDIIGGNNTYGIYGKTVNLGATGQIKVGDNSVGIFSNGEHTAGSTPTIDLAANSKIEVGKNEAVGVFTTGENQVIKSEGDMKIGDGSYGFVIRGKGTKLFTHNPNGVTLGNDAVFAYSADKTGNIENKTTLTSTGSKNYGLYAAGIVNNFADINFGTGVGNVGIYSIGGGTATNGNSAIRPTIRVSKSDTVNKLYGIGMAAGYTDDNGAIHQTGTIINYGTIKVEKDNGIGMYATGSGSKAINHGDIELSGKGTTGMYLDNNAIGENYGTIKTVPNITKDGIIGVVAMNGAVIKNYGTIEIKGSGNTGIFLSKGKSEGTVPQDLDGSKGLEEKKQLPTGKKVSGIDINAPGDGTATIKRNGRVITPTYVDTITSSANAPKVRSGATELDLRAANLNNIPSLSRATSIGMYIDTSGVNYTNPIKGLDKLTNLKRVNLIFGTEAARYTSSKDIKIGQNILSPYNKVISTLSAGGGKKFTINSASLTWITTGTQNSDDTFNAVYLSKIPYTSFAKDKDTYNFMDGLEQRYGVEGVGSREKELFNKLNAIGKGEPMLFAQAVDEMKGHQYSNIQQRVQATGIILDKEFDYLRSEWQTVTKDSNKIKTFGTRGEYKTNTAGVIDYKYNAYGVAYVHENEDVKLGKGFGWYTGIVHNRLKFKDLGNSKEEQVQAKIGLYKSVPFDYNNSLNWTISGDIFVGYNRMNRRFLIVDEIFGAKSRYYNYGIEVKNEIGKEFRLSESFSLRPYAALNLEYGRTSKIREKSGEMKLEVKANDYISIRPEVGAELAYKHYFGTKALKTGLSVAYENELGRVANAKNKAKVAGTTADWYNLRGEKEDRKGNVKFDLNLGLDNQMYGVTANVGYDTKGDNIRGGLGIRVIF
ncbi:autotransporter-associated N-terminal domain-containing protein [Fusobacterium polymorphum]|uniref:autotransporter-associated N-terminal domain-containing protein n=1 Tax=Fusobacterium nucleatum subsp. polymorphum TaxID=76857 RepID=UPI002B4C18EB|nr:autotransporter-associated N-terminal domain-containing protein [Fusobacterium polymorphum]WRL75301.1 autotransporter-associated N-terminal domain-containing protein [Fusobacterium polymorphum]